jgi:hypothetical protein
MEIELTTISTKKFLIIGLLSMPFLMFFSIGLAIITEVRDLVLLILPLLALAIYLGQRFSRKKMKINFGNPNCFIVDGNEILYSNLFGYFINNEGMAQSALCLKLQKDQYFQITGSSVGKKGKVFLDAQKVIIQELKKNNPYLPELAYKDIYVRQLNILRPLIYSLIGIILILDVVCLYLMISGTFKLPPQIFFTNFTIIALIPFLKKKD